MVVSPLPRLPKREIAKTLWDGREGRVCKVPKRRKRYFLGVIKQKCPRLGIPDLSVLGFPSWGMLPYLVTRPSPSLYGKALFTH
jgi:hypothetical protein